MGRGQCEQVPFQPYLFDFRHGLLLVMLAKFDHLDQDVVLYVWQWDLSRVTLRNILSWEKKKTSNRV